jgi:hypothetical protein
MERSARVKDPSSKDDVLGRLPYEASPPYLPSLPVSPVAVRTPRNRSGEGVFFGVFLELVLELSFPLRLELDDSLRGCPSPLVAAVRRRGAWLRGIGAAPLLTSSGRAMH